jgi:hypothetical protein
MTFKDRFKDPRFLTVLGMVCLLAFNLVNVSNRWIQEAWRDWSDGASGLFLGMAMTLILISVRLRARQWRDEKKRPCA